MIFEKDKIYGDEILYRAIPHGRGRVKQVGTSLRPNSDCFLDPSHQISVNCASRCAHNAGYTQRNSTDYICRLTTEQVKNISNLTTNDKKGCVVSEHAVEVYYDPLGPHCLIRNRSEQPENLAHALIVAHPHIESKSGFRKLRDALARISRWEPNFAPTDPN